MSELNRIEVEKNSVVAQDQDEYTERYNEHIRRYEELEKKIAALKKKKELRLLKSKAIGGFLFEVLEVPQPPAEFDTKLWIISTETVTVHSDGRMVFKFKNGTEIEV